MCTLSVLLNNLVIITVGKSGLWGLMTNNKYVNSFGFTISREVFLFNDIDHDLCISISREAGRTTIDGSYCFNFLRLLCDL